MDNTYATIQHPNRRGSQDVADDGGNYATLRGTDNHGNHRDVRSSKVNEVPVLIVPRFLSYEKMTLVSDV